MDGHTHMSPEGAILKSMREDLDFLEEMVGLSWQRKVLIVEDRRTIANLLYVLRMEANYETEEGVAGPQMLTMVSCAGLDAVMIDLRCDGFPSHQAFPGIRRLCVQRVERILSITVDVSDRKTLDWLESHCIPQPQHGMLWATLQGLLGIDGRLWRLR
jgi:hypothetical protein